MTRAPASAGAQGQLKVSAVIVNYNGLRFLEECLQSLKNAFHRYALEIVVVDNCSTDGSREALAARSDIVYVASPTNSGFTGGNNLGAEHASADLLLFINNDTRVETPLDPMLDLVAGDEVDLLGCRLVYADGRQQFSFGYAHHPGRLVLSWLGLERRFGLPRWFRRLETDPLRYRQAQASVDWVSGACFAIRKTHWQQLQGFDTRFFMYCEDVDLCVRARQIGLRVGYSPVATVLHYEGAGRPWIGRAALQRTAHSYRLFTTKHYGAVATVGMGLGLGLVFLARSVALFALSVAKPLKRGLMLDKARAFASVGWQLVSGTTVSS